MAAVYCLQCGSAATLVSETIDERYPLVRCGSCAAKGKTAPGSRSKAYARKIADQHALERAIADKLGSRVDPARTK